MLESPKRSMHSERPMAHRKQIEVKGVAFELTADSGGCYRVSRNGKPLRGHVERTPNGRFRVSFIEKPFNDLVSAVEYLAYWYTTNRYKKPLRFKSIQWPDESVSGVYWAEPDSALQLTLWQIDIQMEEAREGIAKLTGDRVPVLGKHRVYKALISLKVHRTIELTLKVLLGKEDEQGGWHLDPSNRAHHLSPLYDKLETRNSRLADQLDQIFQKTVMIHGDPKLGKFCNPVELIPVGGCDGIRITPIPSENSTFPAAKTLRDHLALMDMNSTYNQAYLGDAVRDVSEAYLRYLADAGPFLDFAEAALRDVVVPSVEHVMT